MPSACTSVNKSLILTNGKVIVDNDPHKIARGLKINDDKISEIYYDEVPIAKNSTIIDLHGATVLPGFIDAHFHLESLGAAKNTLDLRGMKSKKEVLAAVAKKTHSLPAGAWIMGAGWDQYLWDEKKLPSSADLDDVADNHPILLDRIDGHAAWVNTLALKLAGINHLSKNPAGGEIHRDEDGVATGILVDKAIDLVQKAAPAMTDEELEKDLTTGMQACVVAGLSSVHDMSMSPQMYRVLKNMEAEGKVTLRVSGYLYGDKNEVLALLDTEKNNHNNLVRIAGVKFFADGSLGSHAAALLEPYADKKSSSGLELTSAEAIFSYGKEVQDRGYQIAIHAIGDKANKSALNVLEKLRTFNSSVVHRIEHAQIIKEEDWPRFAEIKVIASMQPTHCTSDMAWVPQRLGEKRLPRAYPWQSLLKHDVQLAFGSDAPVESENPWLGVHAACTRQNAAGLPQNGFMPHERVSIEHALKGFSSGAARAGGQENLGVIKVGALADLSIVSDNPYESALNNLTKIKSLATIVNGTIQWSAL